MDEKLAWWMDMEKHEFWQNELALAYVHGHGDLVALWVHRLVDQTSPTDFTTSCTQNDTHAWSIMRYKETVSPPTRNPLPHLKESRNRRPEDSFSLKGFKTIYLNSTSYGFWPNKKRSKKLSLFWAGGVWYQWRWKPCTSRFRCSQNNCKGRIVASQCALPYIRLHSVPLNRYDKLDQSVYPLRPCHMMHRPVMYVTVNTILQELCHRWTWATLLPRSILWDLPYNLNY